MDPKFKPLLAEDVNLSRLQYPVLVSPKLDGVRATILDGVPRSRSLKQFPNPKINELFHHGAYLDGELIVGSPTSPSVFRDTMSVVMAHAADTRDLRMYVFDEVGPQEFRSRLLSATNHVMDNDRMVVVPHTLVENESQLLRAEDDLLASGYEGVMLRDPLGRYKFGRSTINEGILLKLKRKMTSEAVIVGFVEQMHNANEAKIDNLGYMERSSHQANLVPMGVLGALTVRDDEHFSLPFNVGTGFSAAERQEYWTKRHELVGLTITYEYLPVGVKDRPRHPTFKGWRDSRDMSK